MYTLKTADIREIFNKTFITCKKCRKLRGRYIYNAEPHKMFFYLLSEFYPVDERLMNRKRKPDIRFFEVSSGT